MKADGDSLKAFKDQVIEYKFKTSLFDTVVSYMLPLTSGLRFICKYYPLSQVTSGASQELLSNSKTKQIPNIELVLVVKRISGVDDFRVYLANATCNLILTIENWPLKEYWTKLSRWKFYNSYQ